MSGLDTTNTDLWVNVYDSGGMLKSTSMAFDSYDKAITNHKLLSKQLPPSMVYLGTFKLIKEKSQG